MTQSCGSTAIPAVLKFIRHAQELGIDTQHALLKAGLEQQSLSDNSQRISCDALEQLLAQLINQSGDLLFGLHSARYVQPGSWSVLGYITMNCATLGDAMRCIVPYEKLVGDMGSSCIEHSDGLIKLVWNCHHQPSEINRHLVESVLASWLLYAQWLTDCQLAPHAVWFSHPIPVGATLEQYSCVFKCPVLFEQPCNALWAQPHLMQLPLRHADAQLLNSFEAHAATLLAELNDDQPLPIRVKHALRLVLQEGLPRKERLAEKFSMTPRTLQRHLQLAGTGYQEILDELRQELAQEYLRRSDLSVQEIAAALGFSDVRSLQRSFKRWHGASPSEFRHFFSQDSGTQSASQALRRTP